MIILRSALFNIVMYGSGAVLSLYGHAIWRIWPERVLGAGIMWAKFTLGALRVICGTEIELIGRENLPQEGPVVIAAQHQSAFDTMVWLLLLAKPVYVLKQELLKQPLMGALMVPAGFIPVDRDGGAAAIRQLVKDSRKAAAAGKQIVIFPEGTRVPPGERVALLPGVVAMANALNLPVVPAATDSGRYWGRNAFRKYPGQLKIKIYPAVPAGAGRAEIISRLNVCFYQLGVDKSVDSACTSQYQK
ncbi:MAG TPA: lysophospholipid acyltransferase family protein [Acidocella sp.]|nr:MAG: hypothetical protein B7Z71_12030 [Acidocella sp. 21-58-7]HQU05486.1 lysophospholipid acyltransferase family protein [Acidocella sp.]